MMVDVISAVIIGRNEGPRLTICLASIKDQVDQVVYVDSGSTDDSQAIARAAGAHVIALDPDSAFTAARARNAGISFLQSQAEQPKYIQFIDGDCTLRTGWIGTARDFLDSHPQAAVACGRRREISPEVSVFNRLIDMEWDTPIGKTSACGGDALMRLSALQEMGGYLPHLIAGEEPDLCIRFRAAGWTIWRLDAEMTWHDAALTRFSQWWKRSRRAGHAFAEGAAMHGAPPERHGVRETRSALFWGAGLPLLAIFGLPLTPWAPAILLAWPAQVLRLRLRQGDWAWAFFVTLGKVPGAQGIIGFWWSNRRGIRAELIEYK